MSYEREEMLDRMHPRLVGKGWRLLEDDEVIERTDQAVCMSTMLAGGDDWHRLDKASPDYGDEWADVVGKTVAEHINGDGDGWERAFRRRVSKEKK